MATETTSDRVHRGGPVPVYSQIYQDLRTTIERDLHFDDPLPSERDLSQRYGVARMTARKTIDRLVSEGRAYRVAGRGAYVARPRLMMPVALKSFSEDISSRGMRPDSQELNRAVLPADSLLAEKLSVKVGDPVHVLERLRLADGEPIAVECTHLPAFRTPEFLNQQLIGGSLYALLEQRYGLVVDEGEQTISANPASPAAAKLLGVAKGSAALCFERLSFAAGAPIEYATSVYRGDRYQLRVTFDTARS
ncbi:GntR family transcriptional regulator [Nakamurella sp. GG22]